MVRDTGGSVHESVLAQEVVEAFTVQHAMRPRLLVDCTLGGGGHSERLLMHDEHLRIVGFDCDGAAIERVRRRLERFGERFIAIHDNFSNIATYRAELSAIAGAREERSVGLCDGILADLGFSSDQLDDPERGFSFQTDGELDMRLDRSSAKTAAEVVNEYPSAALGAVLRRGGVGTISRRLAEAIVSKRPIMSTQQLAQTISQATPIKLQLGKGSHPATVPFQAIRIEVNDELKSLESLLQSAFDLLLPGGRLAVISFHSLEDKLVTRAMRSWSRTEGTRRSPVVERAKGTLLTPKAIVPNDEEVKRNPRARSARLRIFERSAASD